MLPNKPNKTFATTLVLVGLFCRTFIQRQARDRTRLKDPFVEDLNNAAVDCNVISSHKNGVRTVAFPWRTFVIDM